MTARFELSRALAAKADAEVALDAASVAAIRAAQHLHGVEAELAMRRATVQNLVDCQADAIKQSIRAGQDMPSPPPDSGPARLALADAEGRVEAARLAHNGLVAEETAAAQALATATANVRAAVLAVAAETAEGLADQIEDLESEAMLLRVKLGGASGFVSQALKPVPLAVRRVVTTSAFVTNTPEYRGAASWADRWRQFLTLQLHFSSTSESVDQHDSGVMDDGCND
jgi:hypothetical protein